MPTLELTGTPPVRVDLLFFFTLSIIYHKREVQPFLHTVPKPHGSTPPLDWHHDVRYSFGSVILMLSGIRIAVYGAFELCPKISEVV